MKCIIAGSRTLSGYVEDAIKTSGWDDLITEVVSGGARGVDKDGEYWARCNDVPFKRFPADWSAGRGAGFARNTEMAQYADALLAIWDEESRGTAHMISEARRHNLRIYVFMPSND